MNTRCPPKRVPSAARFFTRCRLTEQPPQSYSVGGQRSSGQLTGKPAGARPDHRGRWCAVSRGHPGRPKPSPSGQPLGAPVLGDGRNLAKGTRSHFFRNSSGLKPGSWETKFEVCCIKPPPQPPCPVCRAAS
ncbi:UNVERIFIED_CONTAM: hypothetical protein FKN15_070510 [Acipenser sinensis]